VNAALKRWLSEPLIHFVLLGGLLFGLYGWLHHGDASSLNNGTGPVRVTEKEVTFLTEMWRRQHQRAPNPEELRGLIAVYLKEELLGREARTMGLDQNDLVIRRRLAQKLEFIVEDSTRPAEPTEAELRRLYNSNVKDFERRGRVSFSQVFFNPATREDAAADAKSALIALRSDAAAAWSLGDAFPIGAEVRDGQMESVGGQFGRQFAATIFAQKPGEWHGPIASSYGLHLVRVTKLEAARQLDYSEAEPKLREYWRDEQRRQTNQRYFTSLLGKYGVVVDASLKQLIGAVNELAMRAGGQPVPAASESPGL
jgi:hypothetical protein